MPPDSSRRAPWAPLRSLVGTIFRTWALLGGILHILLRFGSPLGDFCASWTAPGSILKRFGSVREVRGLYFSRFSYKDLDGRGLVFCISSQYAKT